MKQATSQSASREERLHNLIADYLDREAAGQTPERNAWLSEHADFANELRQFLDEHERMARLGSPLRALAAPGSEAVTIGGSTADTGEAPAVVRRFGDYELLAEIARGGMGVVFKARQKSLNRPVALKMILAGQLATALEVERFQSEARAAGHLDHPNIVPIYEVGQHDGQHYFSMKLIEGDNLAAAIAADRWPRHTTAGQRAIARLVAQAARAVHYAHQRGILHRDLKPGNILLDRAGTPHVTDFGLAKHVTGEPGTSAAGALTHTGAVVGTPSYMAPEQAAGNKQLTTAADVYSLGAILYEMLTGQPPFRGANAIEIMVQVTHSDPAAPRSHNAAVESDLQTICLKCLDKDPGRRYASAEALADDLQRWLAGEPIHARPATRWERTIKWIRRRPATAALIAVSIVALALMYLGGFWFNYQLQAKQTEVEQAQGELVHAQAAVAREQDEARNANLRAQDLLGEADGYRIVARSEVVRPRDPALALLLAIEAAQRSPRRTADHNNALAAAITACREVGPLLKTYDGNHIDQVQYFAGGRRLLAQCWDTVYIWDWPAGRKLREIRVPSLAVASCALSPDETRLAMTFKGYYEITVIQVGGQWIRGPFVVTDQVVRVFDVATGDEVQVLRGHHGRVVSARYSADGKRIVTASHDQTARIWDAQSGKPLHVLQGHECGVARAEFLPDGRVLTVSSGIRPRRAGNPLEPVLRKYAPASIDPPITGQFKVLGGGSSSSEGTASPQGEDLLACFWNADTGTKLAELRTARRRTDFPMAVQRSRDGKRLLGATERGAAVWDTQTGKEVARLAEARPLRSAQLSDSGARALTVDHSRTARIWDVAGSKEQAVLRGHTDDVTSAQFSPDPEGRFVLTTSSDKTARLWETATGMELMVLKGHALDVLSADFSPDGRHVVTGSADGTVRFWNITPRNDYARLFDESGQAGRPAGAAALDYAQGRKRAIGATALSPDGQCLAAGYDDGTLRLFDAASGKERAATRPLAKLDPNLRDQLLHEILAIAWTPDGKRVLTLAGDALARGPDNSKTRIEAIPYSPVRIYDGASGAELSALGGTHQGVRCARISPDGTRVVTGANNVLDFVQLDRAGRLFARGGGGNDTDRTARIWDTQTGRELHVLAGDWKETLDAAWDAQSQRIATVHENSTVRIWDATTGRQTQEITDRAPGTTSSSFTAAVFHPDGRHLLTWHDHGIRCNSSYGREPRARVWDLASGELVFAFKNSPGFATYSPDGRWIVTTGYRPDSFSRRRTADTVFADRTARLWDAQTGMPHAVLKGHERAVHFAAFSKDSRRIVTASEDRTARVWDVATGKEIVTLHGHEDAVKTAHFSGDMQSILTVAWDGTARLWPVDPLPTALERRPRPLTTEERERFEVGKQP